MPAAPNAISIVKRDHRAVKTDYKLWEAARAGEKKNRIASRILAALEAHARMEEEIFYPAIEAEGNTKARDHIVAALAEHGEMKEFVKRLKAEMNDLAFGMKMDELMAGVLHHVKEEEKVLLPAVERSLTRDRLIELGAQMDPLSPSRGEKLADQVKKRIAADAELLTG